jgi:serine/threonine protein kinase
MWSVGVVMLEVLFGSSDVFRVTSRTRAKVEAQLGPKASRDLLKKAELFRSYLEYCIYEPVPQGKDLWLPEACDNDETFAAVLKKHDPLGRAPDKWLTKLIRRLLQWDPAQRITAEKALSHAYFTGPHRLCIHCACVRKNVVGRLLNYFNCNIT